MNARGWGAPRPWTWLLAVVLSLLSSTAMALGLGQIRVLSGPGEPLRAEIPIVSNEPGELENARARLASPETFARVGLQPPQGLVRDLQFEIAQDAQGRAVVRVTSAAPVDTAAVAFLIEVDWGQGRLVREYSALVNAPQTASAIDAPAIEAPAAAPADTILRAPTASATGPEPLPPGADASAQQPAPAPPPQRAAVAPIPVSAGAGEPLVRVERGQTLSQLAVGMDRSGHTLNQAMLALLRANPEAFIDGNIHRVRAGAILRMPGASDFAEADPATAAAMVREQTAQWRQARRPIQQPAEAGGPAPAAAAATAASAAASTAAAEGARLQIAPAVAAGTQATRSGLGAGGEDGDMLANEQLRQAQEDLATRDSELQELRSRVEELEKLQQQQSQLIALKDSDLATAQQRLAQIDASAPADAQGGAPLWLWGGLVLLVAAAVVWWLARRPKPLPIPVARDTRGGFDAASLAAAAPQSPAIEPTIASDVPEEAHHPAPPEERDPLPEPPATARPYPAAWQADREAVPAWHTDDVSAPLAPLNPSPAGRERLELAIAYLDLGDTETARTLLHEVAAGQDPAARDEALQLLREIG